MSDQHPSDPSDPQDLDDRDVLACDEAIRLLARYLDGELERESRGKLEEHLNLCRSCYSRHEFEKGLKEQLARLGQEPVRPEFQERIRGLVSRFSRAGRKARGDGAVGGDGS